MRLSYHAGNFCNRNDVGQPDGECEYRGVIFRHVPFGNGPLTPRRPSGKHPRPGIATHPMAHHKREPRRKFLEILTNGIDAAIKAVAAIPGLGFLAHPLRKETVTRGSEPIRVASKDEIQPGKPLRVNVIGETHDAWLRLDAVKFGACWLVRQPTGDLKAYSTVCP